MVQLLQTDFDTNKDGYLSQSEIAAALRPALAPLYPLVSAEDAAKAFMYPGIIDVDGDGKLGDSEIIVGSQLLSTALVTAFGDVNKDGTTDSQDLVAASQFLAVAPDATEGTGLSFLPSWFQAAVDKIDAVVQSVPADRLRISLIFASTMAFGFALVILWSVFRGYTNLFLNMQS